MVEYSVVIPVYNSALSLEELIERIHKTLQGQNFNFEIICVNDCSTDDSWIKLKVLKEKFNDTLKIISLAKNFGQHSALFCGFTYAVGDFVITIDDDLQHAPEDMLLLIEVAQKGKHEAVYGMSKESKPASRKFVSWLWNFLTRKIDNGIGRGSAFRIMNRRVKNAIIKHPQGVIFIDEIMQWHTNLVGFVEVSHYPRKHGKSTYSPLGLFNFITKVSFSYSTVPLKLLTLAGGFIAFVSFLGGLWFIFGSLFFDIEIQGIKALIVALLFSTSLLLIGIGLMGRYLNQIFILLNNKPSFSVNDEIL